MASKEPEDPSNNTAETDEETVALRRKRLRRVSFADREITSVHIFKRDEDYETPPNNSDSKPRNDEQTDAIESENKVIRLFGDLADSDDSKELLCSSPDEEEEGDAEDEVVNGELFLRPKGSPSSGGSTVGSATSNDDNFFGPVSAHFIRPGRLSGSAVSDENHDITMDSTAFSMHFRSLVASEPGDLKTPTCSHLAVEEKTPTQVTSISDAGDAMALIKAKKLFPKSPLPVDRVSGGRDSNDMSLVGDNSHKYDYGRLSPTLEALLADRSEDLHAASTDNNIQARSPENDLSLSPRNGTSPTNQTNKDKQRTDGIDACQIRTPDGTAGHSQLIQNESKSKHHANHEPLHGPAMHRMQNSSVNQIFSQQKSSLGVSLSSSNAWGRQDANLVAAGAPQSLSYVTPSPRQRGSFLTGKTLTLVERMSSIQKSQSRPGLIKTSSPASALLDRIAKSKHVLSGYRSITTPSSIGRKEISNNLQAKHAGVPITNLEEELSKADNKTSAYESEEIKDQGNVGISSPANVINDRSTDVQSPNDAFMGIVQGKHVESPTEASLLEQQKGISLFVENPTQKTVRDRELIKHGSLSGEITFDCKNKKQAGSTPAVFASSPENVSNLEMPSSADTINLHWQDQGSKPISKCCLEDGDLIDNCASGNSVTVIPGKLDSLIVESSLLLPETGYVNGSAQKHKKRSALSEIQNTTKHMSVSHSPLKTSNHLKHQFGSPGKDPHSATHVTSSNEELSPEVIEDISGVSTSQYVDGSNLEPSVVKLNQSTPSNKPTDSPSSFRRQTQCQSGKELNTTLHNEKLQLAGEDFSSFEGSLDGSIDNMQSQEVALGLSRISERGTENVAGSKRKIEDVEHVVGYNRARRSPKVQKSTQHILELVSDHPLENRDANEAMGVRDKIANWTDIPRKLSIETNQLLSPLAGKLNSKLIGKMEDILTHLKKVHLCEMLYLQIQTQKVYDERGGLKTKRCAESRSLLCRIAYEKAKLQLLHVKKEMLLKRVQAVSSGVQTSKLLRLNCMKLMCQHGEGDDQDKSSGHSTALANPEQVYEVTIDEGTKMTHEFKVLDSQIKNLAKSIHTRYKMKGEPTYMDTTAILNDHLKWKMRCSFIRQDLQLWKVDNLNNKNDSHNVVLNYSGFINQRLTLNPGPVSSVLVSNKLNDTSIKNSFPGMDASNVFVSLFSNEDTSKYVASKTLVDETQTTGLVLSNLLDVADELQIARTESQNMVQANFISPSAEQLHLQISFINWRSCSKVIMILNMMCLTHGIYPADITPCKLLQANATRGEISVPKSLRAEIKSAIDDLRVGYPRILRLCQCVSRVLQF